MGLRIEIVMDITSFLQHKKARKGVEFVVTMISISPNGEKYETECCVVINENISRESFEIVFMDDFVRPHIGNYVIMDFLYLKEITFENGMLKFETSGGFAITLN